MINGSKWKFIGCSIRLDDTDVARVYQHYGLSEAEFKRRGNLLAAAPELLEVLESIMHFSDGFDCYRTNTPLGKALDQWLSAGRAAIAKATGE